MITCTICSYRLCDPKFANTNLRAGCVLTWHEKDGTISITDKANSKIYFKSSSGKQDDKISIGDAREHEIIENIITPLAWKYELNWLRTGMNEAGGHLYAFSNNS